MLAKLADNTHNVCTLLGAKPHNKILQYTADSRNIITDFSRDAQKKFPELKRFIKTVASIALTAGKITNYAASNTGKPLADDAEIQRNMPKKSSLRYLPHGLHPLFIAADRVRHYQYVKDIEADLTGQDNQPG